MKTEPTAFRRRLSQRICPPQSRTICPACAAQRVTHKSDYPSNVAPFAQLTLLYCTGCGLGFVPNSGAMLEKYYQQDYASQNRKDRGIDPAHYFTEAARQDNKMLHRYFTRARHQTALLKKHGAKFGDVLDFGSGPGYFLHVCKAARKFAFEPDRESRKYLDYLGATTYAALADIPDGAFDVITASHSIEHLVAEELQDTLRCLLRALNPQGRLLIEVPQGGHSYLHLKGARQDPHTLFFTPQALVKAAKRAGAKILFRRTVGKPPIPRRQTPIYTPNPKNNFLNAAHGGLTLICAK